MKLRFLMSHRRKYSVRDKVIGKEWVYLQRDTLQRQTVGHLKGWSESRSVVSDSLWPCGLYSPWDSPGQNTGVGSLSLLQGIFPTQGSNPGFLHCRQILHQLSYEGSSFETVVFFLTKVFLLFPGNSAAKESVCNAGNLGSIPGSGKSPEEGNGNPLQFF